MTEVKATAADVAEALAAALKADPKLWECDLEIRFAKGQWTVRTYEHPKEETA